MITTKRFVEDLLRVTQNLYTDQPVVVQVRSDFTSQSHIFEVVGICEHEMEDGTKVAKILISDDATEED